MRYWLFQNNQVVGPYTREELAQSSGFSADSLVCPEGRKGTQMGDWQRAGVVVELSEFLLKTAKVPVATSVLSGGEATGSLLPPEPSLKDLAALGTLQEKVHSLENSLSQLQDELKSRENEIAGLKSELAQKIESAQGLKLELAKTQEEERATANTQSEQGKTLDELRKRVTELEEALQEMRRERDLAKLEAAAPAPQPAASAPFPASAQAFSPISEAPAAAPAPAPLAAAPEPAFQDLGMPGGLPHTQIGLTPQPTLSPGVDIPIGSAPTPLAELGGLQSLGSPLPETAPLPSGLPLSPPFAAAEPAETPRKKFEEPIVDIMDLSVSGARKTKRRRIFGTLFKMLFYLVVLGGGVGGGVAYNLGYINKRTLEALIAQARLLARSQLGQVSAPENPVAPAENPQPPGKTAPDLEGGMPDRTQDAIEIVRAYPLPSGQTLGASLEGGRQAPGLSPWMVNKVDENRYQVNFYARKNGKAAKKPKYEFEVSLAEKSVRGLTPKSQALLESPRKASKRARRKQALLDDTIGDSMTPSSKEAAPEAPGAQPAGQEGQAAPPASPPPEGAVPASSAEPASSAQQPARRPRRKANEPSLDELLLPGVPKSQGGNKDLEKLINSE